MLPKTAVNNQMLFEFCRTIIEFNTVGYGFLWSQFWHQSGVFENRKAENTVIESRCPESNWGPFDYEKVYNRNVTLI